MAQKLQKGQNRHIQSVIKKAPHGQKNGNGYSTAQNHLMKHYKRVTGK